MAPPSDDSQRHKSKLPGSVKTLVAGGVAGAVSRTAVAPFERVKILLQVQDLSVPDGGRPRYTSLTQALRSLWEREGARGLFRGNSANCQRIVPQSGIQFLCFDNFAHALFGRAANDLSPLQRLCAGGLAGAVASACTYPMDLMRARISADFKGEYANSGLWGGMKKVVAQEGMAGLYRGLFPSLCGIIPYIGVDFMVFGILKKELADKDGNLGIGPKLLAGGLAGICGQTVAFPLDTVRRKLQVQDMSGGHKVATAGKKPYSGMVDCLVKVVKTHGVSGLFRGYVPNLVKAAPSVAISFAVYESAKDWLSDL